MSAPPVAIIAAAVLGDVVSLRQYFESGRRDANVLFGFHEADERRNGETESLEYYYDEGRDDEEEGSFLHCVLYQSSDQRLDRSDAVRLLLAHGADANLEAAVRPLLWCEYPEEMTVLLDAGADPNADNPLNCMIMDYDNGLAMAKVLVRRGANVFYKNDRGHDVEYDVIHYYDLEDDDEKETFLAFLRAVKAAGSYKAYARAPRIELVRLRSLCARHKAAPPPEPVLERLFDTPAFERDLVECPHTKAARAAAPPLPNEVFWHVLSFWRTSRDD